MSDHGAFHWNELNTRDTEKAKRFYEETLGWTFEDMPMDFGSYWWRRRATGWSAASST